MALDVTIISLVRHGHGTARMHIDGLYDATDVGFKLVCVDIGSPPIVEQYLREQARTRPNATHLRFDAWVSRQTARRKALEQVDTPYVALIDNNMLCDRGWLSLLLASAQATGAALVSPLIVMQGGYVHYSGGRIVRRRQLKHLGREFAYRPQDACAPARSKARPTTLTRTDVDFVESHCCLAETEALRLPGVLAPEMHNAHTMCYAGVKLKYEYGRQVLFEPAAVASIVPIGFGYDFPWMCLEYMRSDRLEQSYAHLRALIGSGPHTDPRFCFGWHAKHFKHLLVGMLDHDRLDSDRLLEPDEVPASMRGYDAALPPDADRRIRAAIVPFLRTRYPACLAAAEQWLDFQPRRFQNYLRRVTLPSNPS